MIPALRPLLLLLMLLGALIWIASIAWAGAEAGTAKGVFHISLPAFPPLLAGAAVGIGTALATWLGAAFGIRARDHLMRGMSIPLSQSAITANANTQWEWAQIAGAYLYVFGLLAATIMWLLFGTPEQPALLSESAASIVGLIVGVVGVVMSAG